MVTLTWEDNKQDVHSLVHTIIAELQSELPVKGEIIVVRGGYRIELDHESDLETTLETVSTIMNQHIENGPDGWMASHTDNSVSVAIRDI